jgi:hypothetical protein
MLAQMLREFTTWTVILLLAFGMLGFGWLTRHPEVAWLERAEEWPLVGPLAERFRRAYLGPPEEERAAAGETDDEPEIVIIRPPMPDGPIHLPPSYYENDPAAAEWAAGADRPARSARPSPPARPDRTGAAVEEIVPDPNASAGVDRPRRTPADLPRLVVLDSEPPLPRIYERRWLLPGTVLRAEPAAGAAEVERTYELASVPVLERRGEWLQVQLRGRAGWADPATPSGEVRRPGRGSWYGRHTTQPWGEALTLIEKRLGLRRPNGKLGPFDLYSDVEDEDLLELLATVGERLDEAYSARFGLGVPKRQRQPTIALFSEEEDFRAVVRALPDLPGHARGFADQGLAVFYVGDDPPRDIVTTYVHELTHVLNRYAIGIRLPQWLEEGLATDLGTVWIEDPDSPAPGMIRSGPGPSGWTMQRSLGAAVVLSGEHAPTLEPFEQLAVLDRARFLGDGSQMRYLQVLLLFRCLLDGDPETAAGFRRFLADAAAGFPPRPERLIDRLGLDWPEIEQRCAGHRRDLAAEAERLTTWSGSALSVAVE